MKKLITTACLFGSLNATAGTVGPAEVMPWHFSTGIGYVNYNDMVDPNTTVLRLSAQRDLFDYSIFNHATTFGIELGAQTGLDSRLQATQTLIDNLGGPAVQTIIKPFWDLLGTASMPLQMHESMKSTMNHVPYSQKAMDWMADSNLLAKVGFAYRQMHFDRDTMNTKTQISPEVQVGMSKNLSKHVDIALVYQGIYSGSATLTTSGTNPVTATGNVSNIPMQNGGLLLMSWKA